MGGRATTGAEEHLTLRFARVKMDVAPGSSGIMSPTVAANFTEARVQGSSRVLGALSLVQVRFRLNTKLAFPARLMIVNLTGSGTARRLR